MVGDDHAPRGGNAGELFFRVGVGGAQGFQVGGGVLRVRGFPGGVQLRQGGLGVFHVPGGQRGVPPGVRVERAVFAGMFVRVLVAVFAVFFVVGLVEFQAGRQFLHRDSGGAGFQFGQPGFQARAVGEQCAALREAADGAGGGLEGVRVGPGGNDDVHLHAAPADDLHEVRDDGGRGADLKGRGLRSGRGAGRQQQRGDQQRGAFHSSSMPL